MRKYDEQKSIILWYLIVNSGVQYSTVLSWKLQSQFE